MTISPEAEFGFFGGHRVVFIIHATKRSCGRSPFPRIVAMDAEANGLFFFLPPQDPRHKQRDASQGFCEPTRSTTVRTAQFLCCAPPQDTHTRRSETRANVLKPNEECPFFLLRPPPPPSKTDKRGPNHIMTPPPPGDILTSSSFLATYFLLLESHCMNLSPWNGNP